MNPRTMFQKIWDDHLVSELEGGGVLLYIDRHFVHEVTSPQAFDGLRKAGRTVRRPDKTLAVADHSVPTSDRSLGVGGIVDTQNKLQVETLERNVAAFGIPYVPFVHRSQGIVHIVGPELGLTLPGMTVVCGDSHTSTHGAFGALAFGIGTSEVEHVLATQTLVQHCPRSMVVEVHGALGFGVAAKDLILHIIGVLGTGGATGHVIEYRGPAIEALDMAGRMTVCNMSIEAGARAGMIAPDETTFAWLEGLPFAPRGEALNLAKERWRSLRSDEGAVFDRHVRIDVADVEPMVTWGTSPETVIPIGGTVPLADGLDGARRRQAFQMIDYMGLSPGSPLLGLPIDVAFIGSCTNGRLEDLRAAALVIKGRHVAPSVRAIVVPGSGEVKARAEAEGLAEIFLHAGFEWRDAGCSMCVGMNDDQVGPGQRCASTSNRNFEGRQGRGARTHLMSPGMVAAAAITGCITDVRDFL